MAIKKNAARQELIVAHLDIGFADPTTYGTAEEAFDLPGNAILLGGRCGGENALEQRHHCDSEVG